VVFGTPVGCDDVLHLVSIVPGSPEVSVRTALWSKIVEISIATDGATNFTMDSTTRPGRSKADAARDQALLASLGVRADERRLALIPLQGVEDVVAELGPRVLSADLYADRSWVAGISDWGDEMDVLFDGAAWEALAPAIDGLSPNSIVDRTEALSRPNFSAGPTAAGGRAGRADRG
jgi:hypothetical protein